MIAADKAEALEKIDENLDRLQKGFLELDALIKECIVDLEAADDWVAVKISLIKLLKSISD